MRGGVIRIVPISRNTANNLIFGPMREKIGTSNIRTAHSALTDSDDDGDYDDEYNDDYDDVCDDYGDSDCFDYSRAEVLPSPTHDTVGPVSVTNRRETVGSTGNPESPA